MYNRLIFVQKKKQHLVHHLKVSKHHPKIKISRVLLGVFGKFHVSIFRPHFCRRTFSGIFSVKMVHYEPRLPRDDYVASERATTLTTVRLTRHPLFGTATPRSSYSLWLDKSVKGIFCSSSISGKQSNEYKASSMVIAWSRTLLDKALLYNQDHVLA